MSSEGKLGVFELQEMNLYMSVTEVPGWAIGRRAQMALARVLSELHGDQGFPRGEVVDISSKGDPLILRRFAAYHLGVISYRALGSAKCLIACGYSPEAMVQGRRMLEAVVRARAVVDDVSGNHARAWLAGRPLGTPAHLQHRYGHARGGSGALFSKTAHADADSVIELMRGEPDGPLLLAAAPGRDKETNERTSVLLKLLATQVVILTYSLFRVFDPLASEATTEEFERLAAALDLDRSIFSRKTGGSSKEV